MGQAVHHLDAREADRWISASEDQDRLSEVVLFLFVDERPDADRLEEPIGFLFDLAQQWVLVGRGYPDAELLRNALLLTTTMNGGFWTLQVEVFGSILVLVFFLLERRSGLSSILARRCGVPTAAPKPANR